LSVWFDSGAPAAQGGNIDKHVKTELRRCSVTDDLQTMFEELNAFQNVVSIVQSFFVALCVEFSAIIAD